MAEAGQYTYPWIRLRVRLRSLSTVTSLLADANSVARHMHGRKSCVLLVRIITDLEKIARPGGGRRLPEDSQPFASSRTLHRKLPFRYSGF